jgi:hypothetical protein
VTVPSVGIFAPGRTSTRSPALSAAIGTSCCAPLSPRRVAVDGISRTSACSAPEAPSTDFASSQCSSSMTRTSVAVSRKKTSPARPSMTASE